MAKTAQELALEAKVAELEAQLAEANKPRTVSFKVSEKGCLQMFGGRIRRMGMTFYATEWETVLANVDGLRAALKQYNSTLARK